jgi:hypothetical protein
MTYEKQKITLFKVIKQVIKDLELKCTNNCLGESVQTINYSHTCT